MHHVREFPFLDKAKEKEFWQDKLQVVSLDFLEYCCRVEANLEAISSYNHSRRNTFLPRKTGSRRRSEGSYP